MPPKERGRGKLPAPLPRDMILKDTEGKAWRLGSQIGHGGFGLIYLASPHTHVPVEDDAVHVIKVEYLENGPLFSELKFYQRAAKQEQIRKWMNLKKIQCLGIPAFWGSGLTEHKGKSYRFMVMERLGEDLQRIFQDCGSKFKKQTVLQLGARMLDTLEYIHENEYVHGDIKAANLLLGYTNSHEVYLADYGLSYRYCPNGNHKQYQENPRKGHNGTIEFTSIDAHKGVGLAALSQPPAFTPDEKYRTNLKSPFVRAEFKLVLEKHKSPSRRGDLEILGYCMLQWLCGKLPWEHNLKDPVAVQTAKIKLMDELPDSVMEWDSSGSSCSELSKFLERVYGLAYDEKPKYQELKKILLDGLELSGTHYDGPLEFSTAGCTQNHCTAKVSKVCLPKPVPKPAQQKQRKMEREENMCRKKTRTGATARLLQGEEKPRNLSQTLPQTEPQQVHFTKPSPNPVKQKQKMQEDTCEYPGRHQAWIMHRKSQAEEKPIKPSSTIQETDPQKKDTGRELLPLNSQVSFSDSKKKLEQLLTTAHPLSLQEHDLSVSTIFCLAFTEERYHYSIAILVLLVLILLSLYFL